MSTMEVIVDSGFYAACSGLVAKTQQLELLAHNLANASTTGFKAQQLSFRSLVAAASNDLSDLNRAINNYGVTGNPTLDLSTGSAERTGNNLDIFVEGPAFLAVSAGNQERFTRDGHLQLAANGQLMTSTGYPVLGDQGPISIPPGTAINISPEGTISADGALVGKLRLVEFDPGANVQEIAPGLFSASGSSKLARTPNVRQGSLESSNVNGVEAAVGLIALQRHAEMLQRALSIFHSEFNRIAATELPRV
jgi:flagellar basal-body rod protein FlgF